MEYGLGRPAGLPNDFFMDRNIVLLGLGDVCVFAVVTLLGFIMHGETALSFLPRFLMVFFPLILGWFLLAPRLGLFNLKVFSSTNQVWRVWLAMLFVAPFAGLVRGALLESDVVPVFVLVLGVTSASGLSVWRMIALLLIRKKPTDP